MASHRGEEGGEVGRMAPRGFRMVVEKNRSPHVRVSQQIGIRVPSEPYLGKKTPSCLL